MIPAHNEQARIGACLRSVHTALAHVPSRIQVEVSVVLDRCRDRSPQLVDTHLRSWPGARALTVSSRPAGTGVGYVRDLGVRDVLHRLHLVPTDAIWLLSTDADTVVPPHWATEQLRYAAAGLHGVAGLAELADPSELSDHTRQRYRTIIASGMRGTTHEHLYAANLGVRADAYLRCGGFPSHDHGEERRLWAAMAAAGCRLRQPSNLRVQTSARTHGRAQGGVADLLQSLQTENASSLTSENVA
ncbi:glycosyltransferase [Pseudonocardia sp. Cha107L01]|uniref:glycosyltransferase n=1 Tax=Pseudonocardia sp. Cha107L01 TaxID=3457576 RepID=UPI00403E5920